jgi:hypothetical protein
MAPVLGHDRSGEICHEVWRLEHLKEASTLAQLLQTP